MSIYNVTGLFFYLAFFYIYYTEFENRSSKRMVFLFSIISILVYIADIGYINGLNNFNIFFTTTSGILLIVIILLYYYYLINKLEYTTLAKVSMFWISTGAFFFFTGTIILFSYFELYIPLSSSLRAALWTITAILSIILHSFITVGLLVNGKKR